MAFTAHSKGVYLVDHDGNIRHPSGLTHGSVVSDICWIDDELLATGSTDGLIYVWDASSGRLVTVLEGHVGEVRRIVRSTSGEFLFTSASDGRIIAWALHSWQFLTSFRSSTADGRVETLQCHPIQQGDLLVGHELEEELSLLSIDRAALDSIDASSKYAYYSNAKVVLVGDTGVGKTGLATVLTGQPFQPTESTHGRHIWPLDVERRETGTDGFELRETLLWDLAGQPGYRLIHQLHLAEVAVALIVFDARSETDPFLGVRHWARALNQAAQLPSTVRVDLKRALVAARGDRGGIAASESRIEAVIGDLNIDAFHRTSAKEGWGVAELGAWIRDSIPWEQIPRISSTELFLLIRTFLVEKKAGGATLPTTAGLIGDFRAWKPRSRSEAAGAEGRTGGELLDDATSDDEGSAAVARARDYFEAAIGRLESRGLVRRLSFGGLVLLQPEYLDAYASAIVTAARSEPDGLGTIAEHDVADLRFPISEEERVQDGDTEKLLLVATVEELLRHEVAMRQTTHEGDMLVFPAQLTAGEPQVGDVPPPFVSIDFEGAPEAVYATLVVRLSRSGLFENTEFWSSGALFMAGGRRCAVVAESREEGRGRITLCADRGLSGEYRDILYRFANEHIEARAVRASVVTRPHYACPVCDESVTNRQATARRQLGYQSMRCPVCEEGEIDLVTVGWSDSIDVRRIADMRESADREREREAATAVLQGKRLTSDYEVLLLLGEQDEEEAERLSRLLERAGVLAWRPSLASRRQAWASELGRLLPRMKVAVVLAGNRRPWVDPELESLMKTFSRGRRRLVVTLPRYTVGGIRPRNLNTPDFVRAEDFIDLRNTTDEEFVRIVSTLAT